MEDYALKKWGSTLSSCVLAHGNNLNFFHGSFSENNYPLVYIHCIIKIMCQALVLGWLDCLLTMCRTKTETLAVVHEFKVFTGKSNWSETFCTLLLYKLFKLINLFHNCRSYISLLNFQITTDCPVLDRFCFFVCCLLILMNLWLVCKGMNHREVGIQ